MTELFSREQLLSGLKKAHAAQDTEAMQQLAAELQRMDDEGILVHDPSQSPTKAVTEEGFYIDQLKSGAADFVFGLLPDNLFGVDGLDKKYFDEETGEYNRDLYDSDLAIAKNQAKREFFDYKGIKPKDSFERYVGAGIRGTVSEGPLAIIGAKGVPSAAIELAHTFAATTAGAIGGETAAEVAKNLGADEGTQNAFRAAGGIIGGTTVGLARTPFTAGTQAVTKGMAERKKIVESADKASDFLAKSDLDGIIKNATAAQPDLDLVIGRVVELQDKVPGLVVPPAAALASNPIVIKNMDRLLRTKPEFLADMRKSVTDAATAIQKRKEQKFGPAGEVLDLKLRKAIADDSGVNLNNANKKIAAIDKQIDARARQLESKNDPFAVGESVKNLMKAQEQAVRQKLSPRYEQVLRKAETDGIELPTSSVRNIYNAVRVQKLEDLFGVEPALSKNIRNNWFPKKEVFESPVLLAGGVKQKPKVIETFRPASVRDLDSLKRNLNSAIRKTKNPDSKTKLYGLKNQLQKEIDTLPESFSKAYRDVDSQFYKELGIPKDKEGLKQLDAARFATNAGTWLAKPEQARDFLSFVGDAGVPVVRDAILLKMENARVFENGVFDGRRFDRFLRQNERLINTVPGLRRELETQGSGILDMMELRARLDNDFNIKSRELTEGFIQGIENRRFSVVIDDILKNPKMSSKYLDDVKNFSPETSKMLKQGVRAGLLEKAVQSDKTMLEFISDNSNVFKQWFGPRYIEDVKDISEASDLLNRINLEARFAIDMKNEDAMKAATRMSAPEWVSLIRDRITSLTTKVAIASSKITTRQAEAKRDDSLMQMLLNPEKLSQVKKAAEASKAKRETGVKEGRDYVLNLIGLISTKSAYFGETGAETFETLEQELAVNQ
jgi:hypothetical protein